MALFLAARNVGGGAETKNLDFISQDGGKTAIRTILVEDNVLLKPGVRRMTQIWGLLQASVKTTSL